MISARRCRTAATICRAAPFRVHRDQRQARTQGEPGELLIGLPSEASLKVGASPHQPGHDGGDGHRALAELSPQPLRAADRRELGGAAGQQVRDGDLAADRGDGDNPAVALAAHNRQCGQGQPDRRQRHGVQGRLKVALAQLS
jgi:hypothetical protein